jgi:hypothetical protein
MASGVAPVAKHLPSKHQTPNSNPCTTKINSSTCSSAGAGFYGKTKSSYAMAGHSSKEVLPSAVCTPDTSLLFSLGIAIALGLSYSLTNMPSYLTVLICSSPVTVSGVFHILICSRTSSQVRVC